MRSLVLLLLALPVASAQTSPEIVDYGLQRTYRAIMAETVRLRYIEPDAASADTTGRRMMGIGRLVVDETISRTGSYFYDVFYRLWRPPPDAQFLSISISERPLPGQGTLVAVRLDGELVFQSRLTPREDEAETLAQQAVSATARRLPRG